MSKSRSARKKPTKRELQELETFIALKGLLEERGWTVTVARHLDGRGGHCVVRGQRRAILSQRLNTGERVEVLVEALRGEDLEEVFVRPDVRELLEAAAPKDDATHAT